MDSKLFCNPLPFTDGKRHTNPDPFVMRWCGRYYCYATDEAGVKVSMSDDLVHWQAQGYAIQQEGHRNFWAPAVLYDNGTFFLYYSHDPGEILQLATSANPLGPFVWQEQLFEVFSIDAHPVMWNGEKYLFYASDEWMGCEEDRPGTCILLDRLTQSGTPEGNPVPVVLPSTDSEIFAYNRFGDGRNWHTIEGPCLLPGPERSFLLYSANCYEHEEYYVHYAVAENRVDLREMVWRKSENMEESHPLLCRSETVEGTGHNTVVLAPDLIHWWMVYHGRPAEEPIIKGTEQRLMYLAPLAINSNAIWMPPPSTNPQTAPQMPQFFCKEKHLSSPEYWDICKLSNTVKLETWFHPKKKHTGVKFSLFFSEKDEQNRLELRFSTGRRQLTIWETYQSIRRCLTEVTLPLGFVMYVPHMLTVQIHFGNWNICLDEKIKLQFTARIRPGALSAAAYHSEVSLYGLSAAQCFSLVGTELFNLADWLQVSPAELREIGLYGENGIMKIQLRKFHHSEELFTMFSKGSCSIQASGKICFRFEWETEYFHLRRVCSGDRCQYYANERFIWSGDPADCETLVIKDAYLHQYEYADL